MYVCIGSKNQIKVKAVEEVIANYPEFVGVKTSSISVSSGVSEQPMSLEETIKGAKNRALNAYIACEPCSYSFGIESGLFKAEGTATGYLEASVCCIYDGSNYFTGLSCGFEVPAKILKFVLEDKMNLSQACNKAGITSDINLGSAEGLIGLLSKGRIDRKEYTKHAIVTALIQVQNLSWYTK